VRRAPLAGRHAVRRGSASKALLVQIAQSTRRSAAADRPKRCSRSIDPSRARPALLSTWRDPRRDRRHVVW
jgi:hypothetical protein